MVVTIWMELCTSYSSNCHHHLRHLLLQWNPDWRHSGIGLPGLSWKMAVKRVSCHFTFYLQLLGSVINLLFAHRWLFKCALQARKTSKYVLENTEKRCLESHGKLLEYVLKYLWEPCGIFYCMYRLPCSCVLSCNRRIYVHDDDDNYDDV